jgi:hypothetical protein
LISTGIAGPDPAAPTVRPPEDRFWRKAAVWDDGLGAVKSAARIGYEADNRRDR